MGASETERVINNMHLSSNLKRILPFLATSILFVLILIMSRSIYIENTDWQRVGGITKMLDRVFEFIPPDGSVFSNILIPGVETLIISFLGTLLAVIISIPVALLSAHNVSPLFPAGYLAGRIIIIASRSVHEIVWGLIFVATFGLGALAGIFAIAFRSIGFLAKQLAESIEGLDLKSVEGLRAAGANNIQILYFGILPQIRSIFISNCIFLFDINIRRSAVLGMVGAGGLGLAFSNEMFKYNYPGATSVLVVILLLVTFGEVVSFYTRQRKHSILIDL